MNFSLNLRQVSEITEAVVTAIAPEVLGRPIRAISTDSRELAEGDLFLALRGDRFDGHNFVSQALAQGAIAAVTQNDSSLPDGLPQLRVEDTLIAYQKIAAWWRQKFSIPIVGITGSVGKTTTKELIAAVLSTQGRVLKTEANYNNEIGVPKTLLNLKPSHDFAVIEMAMRGPGEIALLTEITRPTVGVITNVGTAHIGRLGSREAIALAKCELLAEMDPGAIAILNHDSPLLLATARQIWSGETVTYGLEGGDLRGEIIDGDRLKVEGKILPLPLRGEHNALNYLGAITVARALGIDLEVLAQPLRVDVPEGRSQRYQLADGIVILDETYNAGLESTLASLKLLKQQPGERKIAVLGTMKELGEYSATFHYQVGEMVKQLQLDLLLVLADEPVAEAIAEGAKGVAAEIFTEPQDLVDQLLHLAKSGDCFLFKASHSVGLDRVVADFKSQWERYSTTR